MSWLREIADTELPSEELLEADAVLLVKMTEHAFAALEGSQGPTYQDYIAQDWLERNAFREAYRRFRGIEVQRLGLAVTGPLGAALAGEDLAAAEAVFMALATAKALISIQAERVPHGPE